MSIARVNSWARRPCHFIQKSHRHSTISSLSNRVRPTFGDARVLPPLTVGSSIATLLAAERSG